MTLRNFFPQKITQTVCCASMTAFVVFLFMALVRSSLSAAQVDVYGEGNYTARTLAVKIYADCPSTCLFSFGVKLTYNPGELFLTGADKNENVWYFGSTTSKHPYRDPIVASGQVIFVGGRLDTSNPLQGVCGERILLGTATFNKHTSSVPTLTLSLGKDGDYRNFVATGGAVLDSAADGVSFGAVTLEADSDDDGDWT